MTQTTVNLCRGSRSYKQCRNRATGEDGLCGVCRNVLARRAEADQRSAQQLRRWKARAVQSAFVEAWREQHQIDVWGAPWLCPLCNRAVQDFYGLEAHSAQIQAHQGAHGEAWLDYLALAPAAEGAER